MSLSPEEKRRFLKALEEDPEFRYAVAGLLGLGEVLNELKKLRDDFNKFVELEGRRWEENNKRWEENNKRWEENARRWEENWRRWEENEKRWEENERRWRENEKRWEENRRQWEAWFETWRRFLEDYERRWEEERKRWETWYDTWRKFLEDYERRWEEANKRFARIEEALGALSESFYSSKLWDDLKEELKARGEAVIRRARNAKVDNVDIDLLVETDRRAYVVEVKIRPKVEDVGALLAKAEVAKRILGKETVPILAGAWIGDDVAEYARGKGVLVYSY